MFFTKQTSIKNRTLIMFDFYNDFTSDDFSYVNSLINANSLIEEGRDFVHFDLHLTQDEQNAFNQINITQGLSLDYCLNCNYTENPLDEIYSALLQNIEDPLTTDIMINAIKRLSIDTTYAIGNKNDYIILQFRIETPFVKSTFSWHLDGLFKDIERRVIIPLKGEPTEFYQGSPELNEEINDYYLYPFHYEITPDGEFKFDANDKKINPDHKIDITKISKPTYGQATIFNNKFGNAALHKSPDIISSTRMLCILDIVSAESMKLLNLELEDNLSTPHLMTQTPSNYLI